MSSYAAIALDLGTTSVKGGLLERNGTLVHVVSRPSPKTDAGDGRYESDALAYAETAEQVLRECIVQAGKCVTLGMCSQRSSFLLWNRTSGKPVTPMVSWQDNRGAGVCDELRSHEGLIRELTGLPLTPYYFAPKLGAMLRDNPAWKGRLESGEWLAGTLDTFLIWRWSGGRHFVTDASMAARTQLMDIRDQQWSPGLCDLFGIPAGILAEISPSAGMNLELDNGLILQASVGDQSAALLAGIPADGTEAMVNLGTGGFVVRHLTGELSASKGYLHTLVYQDREGLAHYAIEGTLNSIAAALAPYPVNECVIDDLGRDGIFCIAEPSGLGAPYFRSDLGLVFSQSVDHLPPHRIAILLLEAIIFRVARILEEFYADTPLKRVCLAGGLSGLACLQSGIACCVPLEVLRLHEAEASLQGAATLAAGLPPADLRMTKIVSRGRDMPELYEKYRQWKIWLDSICLRRCGDF